MSPEMFTQHAKHYKESAAMAMTTTFHFVVWIKQEKGVGVAIL